MMDPASTPVPEQAVCLGCGYRLRGLPSQVCPECGRWFDPNDPSTYGKSDAWAWRRWARPPSLGECIGVALLTLMGVVGASGPAQWGAHEICFNCLLGIPLWLSLNAVFILRAVSSAHARQRAGRDIRPAPRRHRGRWIVSPVCVLLVLSTFEYPWPLMVRFRLSQAAFEAAVAEVKAGTFGRRASRPLSRQERVADTPWRDQLQDGLRHARRRRLRIRPERRPCSESPRCQVGAQLVHLSSVMVTRWPRSALPRDPKITITP